MALTDTFGSRLQRKCEEVVHSKQVLLLVIILNVLDCLLIMSEMTLEFYHVSCEYSTA